MKGIIGKTSYWRYLLDEYPPGMMLCNVIRREIFKMYPQDAFEQPCDADGLLAQLMKKEECK
jgi:hypothetical protein